MKKNESVRKTMSFEEWWAALEAGNESLIQEGLEKKPQWLVTRREGLHPLIKAIQSNNEHLMINMINTWKKHKPNKNIQEEKDLIGNGLMSAALFKKEKCLLDLLMLEGQWGWKIQLLMFGLMDSKNFQALGEKAWKESTREGDEFNEEIRKKWRGLARHLAALSGDRALWKKIPREKERSEEWDELGQGVLFYAVKGGQAEWIEQEDWSEEEINQVNKKNMTALIDAVVMSDRQEVMSALIKKGASVQGAKQKDSAILYAINYRNIHYLKGLMKGKGVEECLKGKALEQAIRKGELEAVKELWDRKREGGWEPTKKEMERWIKIIQTEQIKKSKDWEEEERSTYKVLEDWLKLTNMKVKKEKTPQKTKSILGETNPEEMKSVSQKRYRL